MASCLRLGHRVSEIRVSLSNGPGYRVDIWVQGCSIRCTPNCLNPELLPAHGGFEYPVAEILERIRDVVRRAGETVEGLTVLGGEPTDQMEAVAEVLEGVRKEGLTTMVYTGLTIERLMACEDAATQWFLAGTDILLDGPFVAELYDDKLAWRGSRNQRIHCLTPAYTPLVLENAFARQGKAFSICIEPDGTVSVSGLQSLEKAEAVKRLLRNGHEGE